MFLPHILAKNALISEANVPASNGGGRLFYGSALPLYSQSPGNALKEQGEGATYIYTINGFQTLWPPIMHDNRASSMRDDKI